MNTNFSEGTPIRCNRCGAKGLSDRTSDAVRENDAAWRLQEMMPNTACGHLDNHWVYIVDLGE